MGYAERRVSHAYRLIEEFVQGKIQQNIEPDLVHRQSEIQYDERRNKTYYSTNLLDGWVVAIREGRCIVALEDGGILEGELKFKSHFFRKNRKRASGYAYWTEYNQNAYRYNADALGVGTAHAIVLTLDPKNFFP